MSSIIRVVHPGEGWTPLPNSTLRDHRLTLEGLGLLVRLVSRPSNWQIRIPALMNEARVGRDKLRALLNELQTNGYLIREKRQGAGGRWEWESVVSSIPLKSVDGPTVDGKPGGIKTSKTQKKRKEKKEVTTTGGDENGGGHLGLDLSPEIEALPGSRKALLNSGLSHELLQVVADELVGQIRAGVAKFPLRLLNHLIKLAKAGEINRTSWGLKIAEEREVCRKAKAGAADYERRKNLSIAKEFGTAPSPTDPSGPMARMLSCAPPDISAALARIRRARKEKLVATTHVGDTCFQRKETEDAVRGS